MTTPWHYLDALPKGVAIGWDRWQGLLRQGLGGCVLLLGRLMRSDRCMLAGARLQLAGKIQRRYGVAMSEARRLLQECERRSHDPWYPELRSRYLSLRSVRHEAPSTFNDSPPEELETK